MSGVTMEDALAIRNFARGSAQRAVELGAIDKIDPRQLRSHIIRSMIAAVVGAVTMIGVVLYVILGPELSNRRDAAFVGFLFFCGFALFSIGGLTAVVPLWMSLVQGKLQRIRLESRIIEERDDSLLKVKALEVKVTTLLSIVEEVQTASGSGISVSPIFESRGAEIEVIRNEMMATGR